MWEGPDQGGGLNDHRVIMIRCIDRTYPLLGMLGPAVISLGSNKIRFGTKKFQIAVFEREEAFLALWRSPSQEREGVKWLEAIEQRLRSKKLKDSEINPFFNKSSKMSRLFDEPSKQRL